ncbi:MAG: hypothetical protein ICV85_22535 [Tolypothrix sp. T3-bin4]|nr:hypothetical protein [Tolypothrix sp. T3-bin4]
MTKRESFSSPVGDTKGEREASGARGSANANGHASLRLLERSTQTFSGGILRVFMKPSKKLTNVFYDYLG